MRYIQRIDGEAFEVRSGEMTRWACCDCRLVHDMAFVAQGDVIGVAARVNKRATAARRRALSGDPAPIGSAGEAEVSRSAPDEPCLSSRNRELEEALRVADEALRDYACHGLGSPCIRQCPGVGRDGCGKSAGDALNAVNAALLPQTTTQSKAPTDD